jgi:preprotein translocase subunit SecG
MTTVVIVIHLMVVLAMIGLVLLQRSEGGALGIGGGSGAFLSGRGAGNVLTRSTGILAAVFFATSIGLALLARIESRPSDIFDQLPGQAAPAQSGAPQAPVPAGAPASAEELLRSLGGAAPGPQAPPAGVAQPAAPAADAPAAPAPSAPQPLPGSPPAPAASGPAAPPVSPPPAPAIPQ